MITEYGDVLIDGLDEWGHHKVDGVMEEGEVAYRAVLATARRIATIT